ncbi:MAG: YbhB/YbcL family Raf kinase inhibitor-like protein [Terriglobales bacterium]
MFKLETDAFQPGGEIPAKYTCSGADVAPALRWSGAPAGTKSFALIMDDPDAPSGTFTHWVLYGIPAQTTQLAEGAKLPSSAAQGVNGFRRTGYGGPCPPPGKPHRYFFKLFALDTPLSLKASATKQELEQAMKGHVLGQAELMGTFRR